MVAKRQKLPEWSPDLRWDLVSLNTGYQSKEDAHSSQTKVCWGFKVNIYQRNFNPHVFSMPKAIHTSELTVKGICLSKQCCSKNRTIPIIFSDAAKEENG